VKYKILIKQCLDPQRASAIAAEVARWSGSTPDVVYNAVTQKAICIRKEADEDEALRLRAQFGAIGAEVELVPLANPVAAAAGVAAAPVAAAAYAPPPRPAAQTPMPPSRPTAAPMPPQTASARPAAQMPPPQPRHDDDDDEDDEPGRVLSDAEYREMLSQRGDIFVIEKSNRLRNIETICLILAVATGIFLHTRTMVEVATDFFEKLPEERTAKLVKQDEIEANLDQKKKEEEKKKEEIKTDQKKLKPTNSQGVSSNKGGGDPRARVTQMGVLGIVSGQIKGKSVASADIFGKGGFATDIDAILSGVGGLKSGGDGGVGRKGVAGIGYGSGYGSGFGGGGGGVDDLLGGLMGGGGGGLELKKKGNLNVSSPDFLKGGALTGGRSRASIQRVVMQNMAALRYAYNKRLREKPGLTGKITVKFAIDEFGKVIFAQVVESTMADSELESTVVSRVKSWNFEKIDKPGDVTEVTYPFVFSQ
jgi:TonB family protein